MRYEFLQLAETIKEHADGEPVYLLCSTGNWGDALIYFSTEMFLKHFGIQYKKLHLGSDLGNRIKMVSAGLSGKVLLCMGGGGWCGNYSHIYRAVAVVQSRYRFRKIIVLPSTFEKQFCIDNVLFFRRDKYESAKNMPDALFCHDTAFFIGNLEVQPPHKNIGYFFRQDVESSGHHVIPEGNVDLSAQGTERTNIFPFFEHLAAYRVIHTDRLHISIGASLMGREVHLYPGSYFKNNAIYRTSLQPYFDKIHWHERFTLPDQ